MSSLLCSATTGRRFSILQRLAGVIAGCLLSTHLVIVFAQSESDRWQRIYTGDDSVIEMLSSSLSLKPDHILRVRFRTIMAAPQPLKEKPGTKYKRIIETVEFNSVTKRYRLSELRWLAEDGVELAASQFGPTAEWKPVKEGGMMDRMYKIASVVLPFGNWKVRTYRFGESGTPTQRVSADAEKMIGTAVSLSPDKAQVGMEVCSAPDYESKQLSNDEFTKLLGVELKTLGLKSNHTDVISIKCKSEGWSPPQSLLIKLPEGGMLLLWDGVFLRLEKTALIARSTLKSKPPITAPGLIFEQGAIIRGDKTRRELALVFTGDEFGDGAETIIRVLKRHEIKASFFLTGRFYRNPAFKSSVQGLRRDGHYLGAHSNDHLLYCDWTNREDLLITKESFVSDLNKNYEAMSEFGISKSEARFFLPPFEWYNQTISDWTSEMGLQLINFTSGTRSNADYTTPGMKNYIASDLIVQRIKDYEVNDPAGLNGFILLMHIGVAPERTDKFYARLDSLIYWLRTQRYELVRIDQLLDRTQK